MSASLRQAGVELVAAGGQRQVNDAVVAAARELVGAEAKVRLVLWDDEGGRVAASSGGGACELTAGGCRSGSGTRSSIPIPSSA